MAAFLPQLASGLSAALGLKSLFGGGGKAPAPPTVMSMPVQGQLYDQMAALRRQLERPAITGGGLDASGHYQRVMNGLLASMRASGLRGDTGAEGAMAKGAGSLAGSLAGVEAAADADRWQRQVQYSQLLHNLLTGQASTNLAGYDAQLQGARMQQDLDAGNIAALNELSALLAQWTGRRAKAANTGGAMVPAVGAINSPQNTQLAYRP
ncbi:MAG: hypothetical protein CMLOHMNK_02043 [Steroidobacteraceae bacterium]|nr:hypothetical protein [Steroidobacteraceae bacterium]